MAAMSVRGQLLLFGGHDETYADRLDDTWLLSAE
jgi:hypothetical protein